jgi:hypothetical protein
MAVNFFSRIVDKIKYGSYITSAPINSANKKFYLRH